MELATAFRLELPTVVSFVGGGGKSTAMLRLAAELAAHGKRVLVTTTTHLFASQGLEQGPVVRHDGTADIIARTSAALAERSPVVVVGPDAQDGKVAGVPPELVDELARSGIADAVLVEADGARGRPLKAPAGHEPVVPSSTTLLVPVVGITAIGMRLDAEHVHRPESVARLARENLGELVTVDTVARVVASVEGGLKGNPPAAAAVVLVNQVDTASHLDNARSLAALLLQQPEIDAVAIGAVQNAVTPIREVRRRVGAIVLAAGAGIRMGEQVKQLLTWRGKTFIERAVQVALDSAVDEVVVVLGARADEIYPVIGALPVRVAVNARWPEGHSTSIRLGLQTLSAQIDAAIFINADQPLLTPGIVNAIVQRYAETDAGIVAPLYAGKRGSPVLFRRIHFPEFDRLRGEEGGREILRVHDVELVSFASADGGVDVDTLEEYSRLP